MLHFLRALGSQSETHGTVFPENSKNETPELTGMEHQKRHATAPAERLGNLPQVRP